MQQVEGEIGEINFRAFLKCRLQIRETRGAFLIEHHCFAVEDGAFAWELFGCASKGRHAMRPVKALAGQQGDAFLASRCRGGFESECDSRRA